MTDEHVQVFNKKTFIMALIVMILAILAVYFFLGAEREKRNIASEQELILEMQGIGIEKKRSQIDIILGWKKCPEELTGHDAVSFCDSINTEKTKTTEVCLTQGLLRRRQNDQGYDSYDFTEGEVKALACRISSEIPDKSDTWEKQSLEGNLRNIIVEVLNKPIQ